MNENNPAGKKPGFFRNLFISLANSLSYYKYFLAASFFFIITYSIYAEVKYQLKFHTREGINTGLATIAFGIMGFASMISGAFFLYKHFEDRPESK